MVDVCALDLAHRNEVVGQKVSIVDADSSDLCEALIGEERKFLSVKLKLLSLVGEHKFERDIFIFRNLIKSLGELLLRAHVLPSGGLVRRAAEEPFLLVKESLLLLNVILLA